ncbi:hypothetical protein MAR_006945 [Mya arenaria]|uniref:Uncharacterized protein n=1 Tax=Mya arenaria TaxID=6604 RepID=A0ABY7DDK2_MYAAR|nr:hypothetical protein MAR_006945 [Mya arenaria]
MNQKNAPGYGYNPGYEPQPFVCPSVPTNSASIFGLTAHGNNNPPPIQPIPPNEAGGHSQPIYVAQKLNQMNAPQPTQPIQSQTSGVSGDVQQKQIAFLEAKSLIEKIQSGSWTSLPGLCKPGAAFNPDAQNMPGVIDSLAQKPEMAGSPIQRPGVASYQTHRPYFSDSQTNRPGMASSQSQRPGIISSQTHGYGIMSSQTERYGIMSSHTQRPGIMTYQTQGPGIARSQTEIPGIANIQTRIPGIANIQTQIPGIASSQTQIPEIASSQTQIPEIQRSLTQRLCTTNSLTQSPGTVPNQVQIPGIHEDIIQNPLQTESRETMKLDDLGYKGEQKEREHFGREKALEEIDRYRTGRINEVKDVYNRKEDKYVDRLKSSDDKLKKSNDYDKAITGDSFLDEVRRKRMVQDFCRKDGSSEKDVGRKSPTVFDYGHSKNYTVGSLNAYDQDNRYETETRAESQKYREQDSSGKDNYSGRQKPKPADDLYDEVDSYEKMEKYSRSEKDFWGNRDSHRALSYKSETPKENKYEKVVDGRDMDEYKRDRASDLEEKGYSPRDTHDETNTRSPEYINWNDMEYFDKTFDEEMEYTTMDTGHAGATISDERMQSIETKTSQPKDSYERHSMYQSEKNEKEYEIEYRDYERTYELDRDKVEFERKNEIFGLERTTDRGKGKGYTDSFGKERRREKGYERYRKERHTSDEKNSVDSSTGSSEDYRNVREEDRSAYRQRERNEERYNRYQRDRKEQRPRESSGKRHDEDRVKEEESNAEGIQIMELKEKKTVEKTEDFQAVTKETIRVDNILQSQTKKREHRGRTKQLYENVQKQGKDNRDGIKHKARRERRLDLRCMKISCLGQVASWMRWKKERFPWMMACQERDEDCNLSCKDQTGYDNHLKSDLHLLYPQKEVPTGLFTEVERLPQGQGHLRSHTIGHMIEAGSAPANDRDKKLTSTNEKKSEETKQEMKIKVEGEKKDNEPKENQTEEKKEEQEDEQDVECLLYRQFDLAGDSPLLGLDEIYEFQKYNSRQPQHYVCKLCNNKGTPLPEREKQEDIPPVEACEYISQFDNLLQAAKDGGLKDSTLIGLSYIKELFHPTNEEAPKYSCALCKCLCGDNTIIYHLIGKKHRMQYLKCHHEELFKQFTANQRLVVQELPKKIRDLKTEKIPDSTQVLDESARAEISEEEHVKKDEEEEENEEYSGELTPPQDGEPTPLVTQDNKPAPGSGLPAIKFGIKKTEAAPTPAKIKNQSIIKSSRNSKFITVYSGFFKKFPVIGLQWVSEFQKPDPKHEPWYMCFMCQQKLQWKNILDHVTSNIHRLNYMTDKAKAKSLIERFCKDIADTEGPQNVEVMLELNVNTEAFKGVSKIQENIKAHTATTSSALVSNTDAITTPTTTVAQAVQPFGGASTLVPSFPLPQQASGFPAQQLVPSIPPQLANMAPRNVLVPSMPMATSLPDFSIPPPGFPRFPNVSGPPPLLLPPAPSVSMFQITPPPQGQSPAQIAPNLRPTMAPNQPSHSPFGPNFSQSIPNVPFSTTVSHNPSVSQISNMKIPPPAVSISQAIVYPLSSQSVHASQSNVSLAAVPMSVSTPFSKQHPWQTSLPQLTATLIASSLPTAASGSENKIGEIACPSYQLEKTSSENYKARTATDEQYASGYSATTHESYDPEEPGFDRGDKRKYGELDDLNVVTGRSDRIVALKKERYSRSPSGSRETEEFRRVRLRSRSPDSRYNRSKDQRSFSPPRDIYRHHPNESDTYKYSERSYPESSAQYDRELDKDQLDMLLKKYNDREDGFDDFDDFLTNEDSQNKYEPERKVQLRHDRQRIQVNFGPGVSREDIEVPSRADEGSRSKTYDPHGRRERYEDTYEHRRYEHGHSREERSYRSEKLSTDSLERNYEHKAGSLERNGEGYHGRSSSFDREREREKYSFERYRPRGHSREKKEEYVRERTYREDDRLRQGAEGRSDNADKKIRNEPSREEIDELLRQAAEDVVPDKIEDPRYHQIRLEKDRARPVRLPEDRGQDRWHDREEEERYRDRHADLDGRYRDFPNDRRGGRNLSDKSGRNPDVDWHEERGYDRRAGPDMRSDDTRKDMRSANYY